MTHTRDVLLVGFSRPQLFENQLSRLATAEWDRLFISVDGPREGRADDLENIREIRAAVDRWRPMLPGTVIERFRKDNVGSCDGVADAISWAFESSDELIILEDDCAPAQDFLPFAAAMLERYRHDPEVMSIGGFNPLPAALRQRISADYFFTRNIQIWGWATWRNRWSSFPPVRDAQSFEALVSKAFSKSVERKRWLKVLSGHYPRALSWDSYWHVASRLENGLHILPSRNLIENTGMGADASRTMYVDPTYLVPTESLPPPYRSPAGKDPDEKVEAWYWNVVYSMTLWARARRFYRTRIKGRFSHLGSTTRK